MKTITTRTRIGADGVLKLEMPTDVTNSDVEVVVVMQPVSPSTVTDNGYPVDFFEQIDRIEADDLQERPEQGSLSERDVIE